MYRKREKCLKLCLYKKMPQIVSLQKKCLKLCLYKKYSPLCQSFLKTNITIVKKIEGVGPIDRRTSTDKLHHFNQKKKKKTFDTWHVTCDTWHGTCDMWHSHVTCDMISFTTLSMTFDMWHVTCDMWHVTLTCDMLHVLGGEHSLKISAP